MVCFPCWEALKVVDFTRLSFLAQEQALSPTIALQAKQIALRSVERDGLQLHHQFRWLRQDWDVVLEAVRENGVALAYAEDRLRDEKTIVLAAVWRSGSALQHASARLRLDREVVLAAVRRDPSSLQYAGDLLLADKEFVLEAVHLDGRSLLYAAKVWQDDRDLVLQAATQHPDLLAQLSDSLQADKDFVRQVVGRHGCALRYAALACRADLTCVLTAVKQNGSALAFAVGRPRASKDVVLKAVQQNSAALVFADAEIEQEETILNAALEGFLAQRPFMLTALRNDLDLLRKDRDAQLLAVRTHDSQFKEASMRPEPFAEAADSAIAVRGEPAPVASARTTQSDDGQKFKFEIFLMSGASFVLELGKMLPREGTVSERQRAANLDDLAQEVVKILPAHTQVKPAKRVFITIAKGDDGEAVAVTPWMWARPLAEFV